MILIFSHGKESGPWGSKIRRLASTANEFGLSLDSINYSGITSPDEPVTKFCSYLASETGVTKAV
jgi:hypothetical protein